MANPSTQFLLMTVVVRGEPPDLARAATELGVAVEDMDGAFGVVPIDPERCRYAVQVRADKVPPESRDAPGEYGGPWSNSKIEPFGPVRGPKK